MSLVGDLQTYSEKKLAGSISPDVWDSEDDNAPSILGLRGILAQCSGRIFSGKVLYAVSQDCRAQMSGFTERGAQLSEPDPGIASSGELVRLASLHSSTTAPESKCMGGSRSYLPTRGPERPQTSLRRFSVLENSGLGSGLTVRARCRWPQPTARNAALSTTRATCTTSCSSLTKREGRS